MVEQMHIDPPPREEETEFLNGRAELGDLVRKYMRTLDNERLALPAPTEKMPHLGMRRQSRCRHLPRDPPPLSSHTSRCIHHAASAKMIAAMIATSISMKTSTAEPTSRSERA